MRARCVFVLAACALSGCDLLLGIQDISSQRGDARGGPDGARGDGIQPIDGGADGTALAYPNIMFVTSGTFTFPQSSLAVFDMACGSAAHNAGVLGNYVAWLSDANINIADRIRALPFASHWRRVDGTPFANTIDDIVLGNLLSAPRINELGQDAVLADPSLQVGTGTTATGTIDVKFDAMCSAGNIEVGVPASAPAKGWTESGYLPCMGAIVRIYCFSFGAM